MAFARLFSASFCFMSKRSNRQQYLCTFIFLKKTVEAKEGNPLVVALKLDRVLDNDLQLAVELSDQVRFPMNKNDIAMIRQHLRQLKRRLVLLFWQDIDYMDLVLAV